MAPSRAVAKSSFLNSLQALHEMRGVRTSDLESIVALIIDKSYPLSTFQFSCTSYISTNRVSHVARWADVFRYG